MITPYHAKYYAYELTKRFPSDSLEKLAGAVASAQVDLNPHQVDAALFAFQSPLSRGALLADEVGLGKTIEAGLVISQRWAERKRRILVITPSNLRKQWHQELSEKFFLPCVILETKLYNQKIKSGHLHPFELEDSIIICSYQFARNKASDVSNIPWDLVVIDEAHRLRNVYKTSNIIANTLKNALGHCNKLLLTATPLQNSLLELFGLVSFIDEHTFGDLQSFREQFANLNQGQVFDTLKARLKPLCHRTLRRQVTAYVPFTRRFPIVEEFTPEEGEDKLYNLVSEYLQRPNLQALPASQRTLMTLVLRKLLASSTFAIAGALNSMSKRLKDKLKKQEPAESLEEELDQDYEALDETAEEWPHEEPEEVLSQEDRSAIAAEIADLDSFAQLATSIDHNAKGKALVKALTVGFQKAKELGAQEKAIIFTESRRTQNYLLRVLADSQFSEGIVLFNGSNTDDQSKLIYAAWLEKHRGTDRVTGSKSADMRSALVDYFQNEGRIMIATEAGAEGINLQFCSLVVNYDLPWNPQRIEQRIGRCHRYGQKHDVVVVNFLNRKNEADRRVYELLSEKFQLFEGVFGASDEVLGAIGSGVDFEKRVAAIYQNCRKTEEIKTAFDQLQLELNFEINVAMTQTRQKLLENFDDEVREKLKIRDEKSRSYVGKFEHWLMALTRHELGEHASFLNDWFRNDDVDLAVLPLDFKPAEYKIKPLPFYRFVVNPKDETKGLKDSRRDVVIFECRTGHEVFTVGLFASDDGSLGVTQPIVRFGHIALSPASSEQVFIRNRLGQDVPTTGPLVEMAVWRGQSGSPIFYQDRPHEPLEHGREYENTYLLGVAQGFYLGQQDVEINGEQATIRGLGMGISVVIPSSQIIKILMCPTLVEARERKLKQILKDHAPELAELRKRYKGLPA